jgi:hypothetical protein
MIEAGNTYNGRLVIKFSNGWVTYREGNMERECVFTTFTQRHGDVPDVKEGESK